MKAAKQSLCLNNLSHTVQMGEIFCRQCGALTQDSLLGPYQVKRLLGSERGKQVYLAMPEGQAQPVLVKLFFPDPASQHLWERAQQETRLLGGLHHSSILPMLNCAVWNPDLSILSSGQGGPFKTSGTERKVLVVVYQYAPTTFYHLLSNVVPVSPQISQLTVKQLLRLIEQIVAGLALAHNMGVVHGALEPGNVLLNEQLDRIWIADFGLARLQLPRGPFFAPELVPIGKLCEQRGDLTPYWEAVTEASDQYMLAVLCYQLFLHTLPQAMFQRILPVLQCASRAEPTLRFPRITDFSSALAAEFGVGQLFQPEPTPFLQQNLTQERTDGGMVSLFSTSSLPAVKPPLTAAQQADQLEQRGGKWFTDHNYQAAEQAYFQASRLNPSSVSAWLGLADTYFALERYTDALEVYGKVLHLAPNNAEVYFNRATVFEMLGRPDQAARDYERAEQLRMK